MKKLENLERWRLFKIEELQAKLDELQKIVDEQAEDFGLWFQPKYITEDYLQKALRRLHEAIESKTQEECAIEAIKDATNKNIPYR